MLNKPIGLFAVGKSGGLEDFNESVIQSVSESAEHPRVTPR